MYELSNYYLCDRLGTESGSHLHDTSGSYRADLWRKNMDLLFDHRTDQCAGRNAPCSASTGKTALFYERGMCIGSSFLDSTQSDWLVTFYDQWDDSAFCGCSFRDGLRFYDNGSQHYGICGRCTTLYPDVEKFYPLDRWYGCSGIIAFYY